MEFNEESFYQLKSWWIEHGNRNIDVFPYFDNQIVFFDTVKCLPVAVATKFNGHFYLEFEQHQMHQPFTPAERVKINKFIKANSEVAAVVCEWCEAILKAGDGYYEWNGFEFCGKECATKYIMDQANLIEHVVGEDE